MKSKDKYEQSMRELAYAYVGIILVMLYTMITQ